MERSEGEVKVLLLDWTTKGREKGKKEEVEDKERKREE